MVHCPNCGKDNPDKQTLCFWCGTNLAGAEATGVKKPKVPAQKPELAPPGEKVEIPKAEKQAPAAEKPKPEPTWPEEGGGRKRKLAAGIIGIVIVVTIIGAYLWVSVKGQASPEATIVAFIDAVGSRDADAAYQLLSKSVQNQHPKTEMESYIEYCRTNNVQIELHSLSSPCYTDNGVLQLFGVSGSAPAATGFGIDTSLWLVLEEGGWRINQWPITV